jgi:hypothetical protein
MACKYPSSRKQLHEHLSKGYRQISGQGLDGVVAIGLDLIVGKEADLGTFLDFNQGSRNPMQILQDHLTSEVATLLEERTRDYPSERPLDGLMLTLTPGGMIGKPARLVVLNAVSLQCDSKNPKFADLGVVKNRLETLNTATWTP